MLGTSRQSVIVAIKQNIVYFVTLIACIALFYGFVSIGDISNPLIQGNREFDFTMYAPMIRYCIYAVSISVFILVSYVNSHMFREKLKEMSVLITLGMQRSKIAVWYSRDMLYISFISYVIGIVIGMGCSMLINVTISFVAYGKLLEINFFYLNSFIVTLLFFAILYCGMTLINILKVIRWKPIDLLNMGSTPDTKKISKVRMTVEFLLLIGSYYFIFRNIRIYFTLGRNYSGNIPSYESNKFQLAIFVAIILAIFLTIQIVNYMLIFVQKSRFIRMSTWTIVMGKLSYRMKSNVKNMLLVTIVLTLSLCGFSLIPLMAEFSNEYMEHRMVYDVNIPFNYDNIENINDIPNVDYSFVQELFAEDNIKIEAECILEEYFVWETDFQGPTNRKNKFDMPRLAMGISDYNQLRKMAGLEEIHLDNGCFIFHVKDDIDISQFEEALGNENHTLKVANIFLQENPRDFMISDNLGDYIYNTNTDSFLVFPDEICNELKIAKIGYFANSVEKIPYNLCKKYDQNIVNYFSEHYNYLYEKYRDSGNKVIDFFGPIRFRSIEENDISFMAIITKSLGMYIGIIFMLICMAIISIKNILECNNSVGDYAVLYQMGMPQHQIKSANFKENLFFYLLPYIISIINFLIIQNTFIMRFGDRAETYFNGNQYMNGIFIPVVIISIILLLYIGSVQIINFNKIRYIVEKYDS